MHIFEFSKSSYRVNVAEEALLLTPFKNIYKRDKSRGKDKAINELAFVWFYADIKSPYQSIIDDEERTEEIIKDTELPNTWKPDKLVKDAIEFYKKRNKTVVVSLYDSAMIAASAVNGVFSNSKDLIESAEDQITAAQKVIAALEKVPKVMESLRNVEKQLIREIEDTEGKTKGSRTFNTFEDGL